MIPPYKIIISIIAVLLSFIGYGVYIRDILKGKTKPHTFTFLIWSIAASTTWALQVYGGGGVGSWANLSVSLICIFIFFLCLKYGERHITAADIVFLCLALLALALWIVVKQPVWSAILLAFVNVVGFFPTVRKSWNKPREETLFTWKLAALRQGLSMFALQRFNVLTVLYPASSLLCNGFFSILLIVRRKQLKQ